MSDEDKKPDEHQEHIAKTTDYKEAAIKTAYTVAESTMLILGEAGKFIGNMSFAGANKMKELAEKRAQAKSAEPKEAKSKSDTDSNKPK
jgi:hypothetical protein